MPSGRTFDESRAPLNRTVIFSTVLKLACRLFHYCSFGKKLTAVKNHVLVVRANYYYFGFEGLHSRLNLIRSRPWTKMAQWSYMFPNSRGTRAAFCHLKLYRIRCEIAFFRQASRSSTGRWTSSKWQKAGDRALDALSMHFQTEIQSLAPLTLVLWPGLAGAIQSAG